MITVIGAGSGKADSLSLKAYEHLKSSSSIILKTEKMPIKAMLDAEGITYSTLDSLYELAEDFDHLNLIIKEELEKKGDCTYVVHGSALDDTSVKALTAPKIIPGISVSDCALAYLGLPVDAKHYTSFEILSGFLPTVHTDNIITCIDSDFIASDLKCILSEIYGDEFEVIFYTEDYDGNQSSEKMPLYKIDMLEEYNHTTSIYLKSVELESVYKYDCLHLLKILDILCARNGCPWDSVQTHASLRRYLIEEAYEAADAIEKDDPYSLSDELGDVLYQIAFHANIGKRSGEFDFNDVTDAICRKMISRHPHIFSKNSLEGNLNDNWEKLKMEEKGLTCIKEVMEDVVKSLPALTYCEKILHKAEKAGIRYSDSHQIVEEIRSILNKESLSSEEIGKILFDSVKLSRIFGTDPEHTLRQATRNFIDNFEEKHQ